MILNTANGKHYIGSSINMCRRMNEHMRLLRRGSHSNKVLQNAWNKHGGQAFLFVPLFSVYEKSILVEAEQAFIDQYRAYDRDYGYNIRPKAESNCGHKFSKEVCEKNRAARVGKKMSPESSAKKSAAMMGRKWTPQHSAKIAAAKKGISRPCDTVIKIAKILSAFNAESVAKIEQGRLNGMTYRQLAEAHNCTASTIYRVINKIGPAYRSVA